MFAIRFYSFIDNGNDVTKGNCTHQTYFSLKLSSESAKIIHDTIIFRMQTQSKFTTSIFTVSLPRLKLQKPLVIDWRTNFVKYIWEYLIILILLWKYKFGFNLMLFKNMTQYIKGLFLRWVRSNDNFLPLSCQYGYLPLVLMDLKSDQTNH